MNSLPRSNWITFEIPTRKKISRRQLATCHDCFDCSGFKKIYRENTSITFKIQKYVLFLYPFNGCFSMITKSIWHTFMGLFAIIGWSGSLISKMGWLSQCFRLSILVSHSCLLLQNSHGSVSVICYNSHLFISRSSIE